MTGEVYPAWVLADLRAALARMEAEDERASARCDHLDEDGDGVVTIRRGG